MRRAIRESPLRAGRGDCLRAAVGGDGLLSLALLQPPSATASSRRKPWGRTMGRTAIPQSKSSILTAPFAQGSLLAVALNRPKY